MKPYPELEFNPYPDLEPVAFGRGWWHYSQARTDERDAAYLESARGMRRGLLVLQGMALRILYGRRRWKPPRVNAKLYTVEDGV